MHACDDPSSMRFIPLFYHDEKMCDKVRFNPAMTDGFPTHNLKKTQSQSCLSDSSMNFVPIYTAINSVSPPRRVSMSCDGFATSSPFSATKTSHKMFQPANSTIVNSSDSGIMVGSPSAVDSSLGTLHVSSNLGTSISILKRGESSPDDLKHFRRDTKTVEKIVSRDLSSVFEKLTISQEIKDSTGDEDVFVETRRRDRRTQRVPTFLGSRRRRFLNRPSSKFSTPNAYHTNGGTTCYKKISLHRTLKSDGNNNNQPAPQHSSKVRQNLSMSESTQYTGCTFCKSNNEPEDFTKSHTLKTWEPISRQSKLTCPVLRKYICPRCGATGDAAHTFTYCPETIKEVGYRPSSFISKFKRTTHVSSGKRRAQATPHLKTRN